MLKNFLSWFGPLTANYLLKALALLKRENNIWIFGAWGGDSYSDNSRYLFEYVLKNLPEIDAVWITSNPGVKKRLTLEKKRCFLYNEREGRRYRLRAGYVFFTNSITDFGSYDLCHGAVKVALWHGMPLKRLYYAQTRFNKSKNNPVRLFFRKGFSKLYNRFQRDITIATSQLTKDYFIECYEVRPETVYITGQPRNDILFDKKNVKLTHEKLGHRPGSRFILYMPTWRNLGQNEPFLEDIISQLNADREFLDELNKGNITLYIKPHPRIRVNSKSSSNVVILEGMPSGYDTQELIAAADTLITDYSSVFIDYALLERPVHFFIPDKENNTKYQEGLFLTFEEFTAFSFTHIDTFKQVVTGREKYIEPGIENCNKINSLFNDPGLEKGGYSRAVTDVIINSYGRHR